MVACAALGCLLVSLGMCIYLCRTSGREGKVRLDDGSWVTDPAAYLHTDPMAALEGSSGPWDPSLNEGSRPEGEALSNPLLGGRTRGKPPDNDEGSIAERSFWGL